MPLYSTETKKIWDCEGVEIAATCIRVPVMRAHAESINLTFESELDENDAREILSKAAGVSIIDDRANNRFPTPLDATVGGCTTSTQSTLELESA